MITTRLIRSFEEFEELEPIWNPLLQRSMNDSLFSTWEWVSTWARTYLQNDDLFVVVLYDGEQPAAVAPLWRDHIRVAGIVKCRVLRFLGSGEACSDHLDFIVRSKGYRTCVAELWDQLFGALKNEWDLLEYSAVPAGSKILTQIYSFAERDDRCIHLELAGLTFCPYLKLASSWQEVIEALSKSRRYSITSSRKRLSEPAPLRLQLWDSAQEAESERSKLEELNTRIWQARGQSGSFASRRFREFHATIIDILHKRGWLFSSSLYSGSRYLGSIYGFHYGQTAYDYIFSAERDADKRTNTGDVLLSMYIEEALRHGIRRIDFLRGDEPYKYMWTGSDERNLTLRLFNRTTPAVLVLLSGLATNALRFVVRRWRSVRHTITRTSAS